MVFGGFDLLSFAVTTACVYAGRKHIDENILILVTRIKVVQTWRQLDENLQANLLLAEHFRWQTVFWRPIKRKTGSDNGGLLKIYGGGIILGVNGAHRVVIATNPEALPAATVLAQTLSLWREWKVVDCSPPQ